jgi:putative colanic acid biosynthesis UDP-glucose lipid carrier transferase
MDLALSLLALILLSPFLLLVAVLVKLSSPGPVIFRQRRYGLDGRIIDVYKFRTMTVTEDGPVVQQVTRDDDRVTPIGRLLRRYSIDELPQLLNVVWGDMSLVGPRPHAVAHNELYRRLIKGYMVRHKVPPGITGLAQVNGCRGETSRLEDMQRRIEYDLEYLRHWSPTLDLRILFQTLLQVIGDRKAY